MSKKKNDLLPRFEIIIIGVFFLCFLIWAFSKCSNTKKERRSEAALEEVTTEENTPKDPTAEVIPMKPLDSIQPRPKRATTSSGTYTPLYVTIDGMNLREKPQLNSKILTRLDLFDEVEFLNEVTDFREEIKIGEVDTNEPWIKVKPKMVTLVGSMVPDFIITKRSSKH